MTSAPHLLRHAGRVATSYVGLVVGSLIVILVSMNALATAQTRWQLFRSLRFEEISFAPTELASYAQQGDTRTVVITFNRGVAESLKDTVTSLAGMIPAVSSRIIAEAQREDTARASLATGGGFGLGTDAARAVAAQAVTGAGLPSVASGTIGASSALATPSGSGNVVISFGSSPTSTRAAQPAAATQTAVPAASVSPTAALPTSTPVRTATATSAPSGGGSGDPSGTQQPASTQAPPTAPGATQIPPTVAPASPVATQPAATPSVSVPTLVPATLTPVLPSPVPATVTTVPVQPTSTRIPPTPVPSTRTPEPSDPTPGPTGTATIAPTATATATATPPEVAMDLSVPGGSSFSFQPIFSGALEFDAGESQSRTVSIQNNGTRTFQYYLGTSGGTGALWTDAVNGRHMVVTRNGSEAYRGTLQMPDQLLGQLARGGQDTLVVTVYLPSSAGNSYQGLSTTVSYKFTAVTLP